MGYVQGFGQLPFVPVLHITTSPPQAVVVLWLLWILLLTTHCKVQGLALAAVESIIGRLQQRLQHDLPVAA